MKLAIVEAFMPDLKGKADRTGRGKGGSAKAAIARAFADVLRQTKGKRITSIRADITIVELRPLEEVSGIQTEAK